MSFSTITITENNESEKQQILSRFGEFVNILMELTKFRITFFVSLTTFVGYILHNGKIDFNFILPTFGVLILASGASALNEYQERKLDSKMKRTNSRPIPSCRITANNALFVSISLVLLGSLVLFIHDPLVMMIGVFTLLWYNGIYTPIKKKTSLAIIPGALVGALPPVIGWVASGGQLFDDKILGFALFMFIWQIPHFWLLVLLYDDQYKKAGFPTLSKIFTFNQITYITFSWITILVLSSYMIYMVELSSTLGSNLLLTISGVATFLFSLKIITEKRKEIFSKSFLLINVYVLFILIVISIENII